VSTITLARVYGHDRPADGATFLVERLWPRGIRKDSLHLDAWYRDAGPTHELRKWFGHDPSRWEEFRRRYFAELDARPQDWQPLLLAAQAGDVTLLYSSRDEEHNNAVALRDYLLARL
jgi:uncharacterized protein YeaO (DUF488 family)